MSKVIQVQMTPKELTTDGYMKIRDTSSEMPLKFMMDPDFRGKLTSVEWWTNDGVRTVIDSTIPEFENFRQVGERPEVTVPGDWLHNLKLPSQTVLRIKMNFDTFRQDAAWYGYLYYLLPEGDSSKDTEAAYLVKPQTICDCE